MPRAQWSCSVRIYCMCVCVCVYVHTIAESLVLEFLDLKKKLKGKAKSELLHIAQRDIPIEYFEKQKLL